MTEEPMLDFVMRRLRDSEKPLYEIASDVGISYFTLQKWTRRCGTRNPRIEHVQKLADYFRNQTAA